MQLAFHAGNLLEPGTLEEQTDLSGTRLLTDDYAPVDTLVFEVSPEASGVPSGGTWPPAWLQ